MAKNPIVIKLRGYLSELQTRRRELTRELVEIDEAISGLGAAAVEKSRRGRKPLAVSADKPAGTRGRKGRMDMTAEEFITQIVGAAGQLTTKQISDEWKKCRGGASGNTLTSMSKAGKLIKEDNVGGRGSLYRLPAASA